MWTVDSRGTLSPSRQYRKKGSITSVVFCKLPVPQRHADHSRKSDSIVQQNKIPPFFFCTDRGGLNYADDLGHCTEVQQLSSAVDTMLFYEERCRLVIITRSLLLTQYQVGEDGRVSRVNQAKLSVAGDVAEKGIRDVVWAGPGILAIATQEKMLRLLDLAADENYNLSLTSAGGDLISRNDYVYTLAYSPVDRYLVVGTGNGVMIVWKFNGSIREFNGNKSNVVATSAQDWEVYYKTTLPSGIFQLSWYRGQGVIAVITDDGVQTLTESVITNGFCDDLSVCQLNSHEVSIHIDESRPFREHLNMIIRGLAVARTSFVVWSGKSVCVVRVDPASGSAEVLNTFNCVTKCVAIADTTCIVEEALFVVDNDMVRICNYSGVQKASITFSEAEGTPEFCDLNDKYLVVITNKGFIKVMDVHNPKKAKPLGSLCKFTHDFSTILSVRCIRTNCNGTRMAILADHVEGSLMVRHPDTRLHVFDRNKGGMWVHDFGESNSYPTTIAWDNSDDRLLAVEVHKQKRGNDDKGGSSDGSASPFKEKSNNAPKSSKKTNPAEPTGIEIVTFFVTSEHGLLQQDSFERKAPYGQLIGITVPKFYFRNVASGREKEHDLPKIVTKVMRDFVGLTNVDYMVRVALLDFSYNLTLGKLDDAYRAVKSIDSTTIWENMAQMCVKTHRLDVAEVCLSNMGHARGAAALRESRKEGSTLASIGVLAIQLGLLDDAAKCFREAKRYDLLNQLYQAAGLWDKALDVATDNDRIHLKSTHYQYAKYLECIGDYSTAMSHFESSDTHRSEIPRMLYSLDRMDELEDYIQNSNDDALLKWWGSFLESSEKFEKAKKYYRKANDWLSLVRIYCFKGEFSMAAEIVQDTNNRAAAYHVARQLENQGELRESISYYATSGCYNHAIRLAKQYGLDTELMRFATRSTPSLMLDCAAYFEAKGELDKAVQLYHKGGDLGHALDVCFRAGDMLSNGRGGREKDPAKVAIAKSAFELLNSIAEDLGAATSPQTLARCAEFLVLHKQYDKAVDLYIMAKRYMHAIEMCVNNRVDITDKMCERLTPPVDNSVMDSSERKEILKELAKALKKQGAFALASKKFTQAGDRIRAMKCLVRSGNTDSVINFAKISKNAEIYTLAANYLQQMNWRGSIDIMKAIVTFYTQAKAFEQLAGFFESCAQVEIDEYRDYEKAIGALKEALKHLNKANSIGSGSHIPQLIDVLEKRIMIIDKFVQARKYANKDSDRMVDICEDLLNNEPNLEESVRIGDCLAMLIEHFHSKDQHQEANKYLEQMIERKIQPQPFVDADVLADLNRMYGKKTHSSNNSGGYNDHGGYNDTQGQDVDDPIDQDDDEIGEEIEEDVPVSC